MQHIGRFCVPYDAIFMCAITLLRQNCNSCFFNLMKWKAVIATLEGYDSESR